MKHLMKILLGASAFAVISAESASAQDATAPPAAPAAAPVPMPAIAGPLANNPAPYSVDLSGAGFDWLLGKVYLSGVITGGVVGENHVAPGDKNTNVDLFNGMAVAQKTDGFFQWYVQAGAYATPTLGTPYTSSSNNTTGTFSSVPQGYVKLVPTDTISFEAGKLPTLIGAEYEFTYENMNVERGLMWAQEPAVSRGAQANYASGPFSASIALTDGYYSDRYNVLSGMMSYAFNGGADTVALVGSGNLGHTYYGRAGASLFQNNSSILNAIYTHTSGNWTITPYFQYATGNTFPGSGRSTTTSTSGAILASYALNDFWHLAGRFEYVSTSGPSNILYGSGSNAMTFTITPTWQYKVLFVRPEFSYVAATSVTPGSGLGPLGNDTDQFRGVLEAGIMF